MQGSGFTVLKSNWYNAIILYWFVLWSHAWKVAAVVVRRNAHLNNNLVEKKRGDCSSIITPYKRNLWRILNIYTNWKLLQKSLQDLLDLTILIKPVILQDDHFAPNCALGSAQGQTLPYNWCSKLQGMLYLPFKMGAYCSMFLRSKV